MQHHHAAVGIVINNNKQCLVSKRPADKVKGGFWEFPGGKIEVNESPEAALIRELQEEVGIEVLSSIKLMQYHFSYTEHSALLEIFLVTEFKGEAKSLENQEIAWITKESFPQYQFLEANQMIIKKLIEESRL